MEKVSTQKSVNPLAAVATVLIFLTIFSCNSATNSDKRNDSDTEDVQPRAEAGNLQTGAVAFNSRLSVLYVLEDTFKRLALKAGNAAHKLAFQACMTPDSAGVLTLRAWPGGPRNSFVDTSVVLLIGPPHSTVISSEFNISTQLLTNRDVRDIVTALNARAGSQIVAFYPLLRPDNFQLRYDVYVLNDTSLLKASQLAADIRTNPSPPASFLDAPEQ
jgi:hypothetical protein